MQASRSMISWSCTRYSNLSPRTYVCNNYDTTSRKPAIIHHKKIKQPYVLLFILGFVEVFITPVLRLELASPSWLVCFGSATDPSLSVSLRELDPDAELAENSLQVGYVDCSFLAKPLQNAASFASFEVHQVDETTAASSVLHVSADHDGRFFASCTWTPLASSAVTGSFLHALKAPVSFYCFGSVPTTPGPPCWTKAKKWASWVGKS